MCIRDAALSGCLRHAAAQPYARHPVREVLPQPAGPAHACVREDQRRAQLVLMAFDILDADKSGFVRIDDIQDKYDSKENPDVRAGKKTEAEVRLGVSGRDGEFEVCCG